MRRHLFRGRENVADIRLSSSSSFLCACVSPLSPQIATTTSHGVGLFCKIKNSSEPTLAAHNQNLASLTHLLTHLLTHSTPCQSLRKKQRGGAWRGMHLHLWTHRRLLRRRPRASTGPVRGTPIRRAPPWSGQTRTVRALRVPLAVSAWMKRAFRGAAWARGLRV